MRTRSDRFWFCAAGVIAVRVAKALAPDRPFVEGAQWALRGVVVRLYPDYARNEPTSSHPETSARRRKRASQRGCDGQSRVERLRLQPFEPAGRVFDSPGRAK